MQKRVTNQVSGNADKVVTTNSYHDKVDFRFFLGMY